MLARVRELERRDHRYAYAVRELVVFGSYLTDTQRLSDPDLAVSWWPRFADNTMQHEYAQARGEAAYRAGRHFSNYVQELLWAHAEVERFIRGGSRSISLQWLDEKPEFSARIPHQVVYRAPEGGAVPPPVAPSENP